MNPLASQTSNDDPHFTPYLFILLLYVEEATQVSIFNFANQSLGNSVYLLLYLFLVMLE